MSDGFPYGDIIILALIAGSILLRLRSVLGQKTGIDPQDFFKPKPPKETENNDESKEDRVVLLGGNISKPRMRDARDIIDPYAATLAEGPVLAGINAIKGKDASFTATAFLDGAKMAFEMVFDAFAKGEKNTLSMLLATDIYEHFARDLADREGKDVVTETTLLSVSAKEITQASLDENIARIAVNFVTEQVIVERAKDGTIVSGDASSVAHSQDEWVFERDVTSKNPNWKIIET